MGVQYWQTKQSRKGNIVAYDLTTRATLATGMQFDVETGSGHHILLDAAEHNGGQNKGPNPMEMFLVGLAGCAGMDIISILRKKRQNITAYEIRIHGERTEEIPRIFVEITIEHIFTGHTLQTEAVQRAIDLTEEKYCGASAILRKAARLMHTFRLIEAQ